MGVFFCIVFPLGFLQQMMRRSGRQERECRRWVKEFFILPPNREFIRVLKCANYFFHLNVGIIGLRRSGSSSNTDSFLELEKSLPFSLL